ncbi:PstS family phosphate ABC transporter substrate-binding protein [Paenibacillus aquistagni]|uniref:Phosphate-binding protein n=1 Tax=Paenibacillus aquistagni TaxID=1852522 RepID=A0A1X7LKM8_9BACL|nr:PstS family phosphate ABC transporter substrate-binding protein [Paenibacillus aquistagni]SMG54044.1 phosphate ABC transporter substrate-binding protein, PhoT family [Paenibacillus aquistagni]
MNKLGKRLMTLTVIALVLTLLSACGGNSKDNGEAALSGTINIDGSSTVFPMTEAIAEEFSAAHKDVRVSVGTSGTGSGFKRFARGETELSNASRPIKEEEAKAAKDNGIDYQELTVAYDGLAIVVNKDNDWVDKLTLDELKKIYEPDSKVKTWADVREGWPATELRIYSPGSEHGTFDYFTEAINGESKAMRNDKQITFSADTNAIVQGVSGDSTAIGYFGYSFFEENQDKLKLIPVDNGTATVTPSPETVKDGSYTPLSRPLLVYVDKAKLSTPEVKAFVEFYLENAGAIAPEVGYVPLPDEKYTEQLEQLK